MVNLVEFDIKIIFSYLLTTKNYHQSIKISKFYPFISIYFSKKAVSTGQKTPKSHKKPKNDMQFSKNKKVFDFLNLTRFSFYKTSKMMEVIERWKSRDTKGDITIYYNCNFYDFYRTSMTEIFNILKSLTTFIISITSINFGKIACRFSVFYDFLVFFGLLKPLFC